MKLLTDYDQGIYKLTDGLTNLHSELTTNLPNPIHPTKLDRGDYYGLRNHLEMGKLGRFSLPLWRIR